MDNINKQYFPEAYECLEYQGLDVLPGYLMVEEYLATTLRVLELATSHYTRVCVSRFDLRLPERLDCPDFPSEYDTGLITEFILSLKSQNRARCKRKKKEGKLLHESNIRYVWAREIHHSNQPHYHVALLVNKDVYRGFGNYLSDKESLGGMIIEAYARALQRPAEEIGPLVNFATGSSRDERNENDDPPVYYLDKNSPEFQQQLNMVFRRLSYLCKLETKPYGNKGKNFVGSRY
ncbi:inovirus Gp2 family protein [Vibrio sp. HN007]|uniref:inovirus Gp2 family protein n=1 Tax=Vibrio iocasae TaxID=3098914 RepID=UPI0035D3F5BF